MFQANIALLSPPYATLTYLLPNYLPKETWKVGQRVAVPLGKGLRAGVIVDITTDDLDNTQNGYQLKNILWPLEKKNLLRPRYLELAEQMALRQTISIGRILGNLLPQGQRSTQLRIRCFYAQKPKDHKLKDLLSFSSADLEFLGGLWQTDQAELFTSTLNRLDTEGCVLLSLPPWPVRPAAKKQLAILEFLHEKGLVSRRRLAQKFGESQSAFGQLLKQNLIAIRPLDLSKVEKKYHEETFNNDEPHVSLTSSDLSSFESSHNALEDTITAELKLPNDKLLPRYFTLTTHQLDAYEPLKNALLRRKAESHLLFGVTGSGKTAVYLELARTALNTGRSVLLLAPEVALAYKLWGDVSQALPGADKILFHGYQSPATKESTFKMVSDNDSPRIIVGTRSALFLPLENIGLIVIDEEHDSSFKQDEGFTYQAKEVAWFKAGQENALLLLGSATPDVKSFYAAQEGKLPMVTLHKRINEKELPAIKLITLPRSGSKENLLAKESIDALQHTVEKGEQAVILLNRRGYAPLLYCLGCATVIKCPHCDIALAYHKSRERLLCHYCGHTAPFPSPCPSCKHMHFLPMGEGTEKIEEALSTALPPGTGILRLDRDSTRRPGELEDILHRFAKKEASVLVGTQMLSKGHHFPDVTLAIVADADLGLNLPDYRATERTFQLLLQSAGRAGRGEKTGTVLIQTRDPNHYCWQHIQRSDYEAFYAEEIALRKKRRYPPFVRLALVRISYQMQDVHAMDTINSFGAFLRKKGKELGVQVLGPVPAPLPFLQGRRRFHCMLKADDWQSLRQTYAFAVKNAAKGALRISLDLDPMNML